MRFQNTLIRSTRLSSIFYGVSTWEDYNRAFMDWNCWCVSHSVTHKHELWIWFTLSYAMMKALLRLAAARDTKQAGELRGDTVHFIASSSELVLMTQNGNIYRPLKHRQRLVFYDYTATNISQKTVNGSGRRQLAHGTTDEKRPSKVPRDHKYMHRKAIRKTHSTNGVNIESRVT